MGQGDWEDLNVEMNSRTATNCVGVGQSLPIKEHWAGNGLKWGSDQIYLNPIWSFIIIYIPNTNICPTISPFDQISLKLLFLFHPLTVVSFQSGDVGQPWPVLTCPVSCTVVLENPKSFLVMGLSWPRCYPLVIHHKYEKSSFIVFFSIKHSDCP